MQALQERDIFCPYCGELISVLLDCSEPEQEYVEDCSVCCSPITLQLSLGTDGEPMLSARRDSD